MRLAVRADPIPIFARPLGRALGMGSGPAPGGANKQEVS